MHMVTKDDILVIMKPTVYIETSIVSYYAARPSRDLVTAGRQQITIEWWEHQLTELDPFVSTLVLREAAGGDPVASAKRLDALTGIPILELTDEALRLAQILVQTVPIPAEYADDALHIAITSVHGVEYLVTWNCTHIANARLRPSIMAVIEQFGLESPVICTPEELMGGSP